MCDADGFPCVIGGCVFTSYRDGDCVLGIGKRKAKNQYPKCRGISTTPDEV